MVAIAGPVAERLSTALLDAFTPDQLDQMLFYKLGRSRVRISMARNFESIIFDLVFPSFSVREPSARGVFSGSGWRGLIAAGA